MTLEEKRKILNEYRFELLSKKNVHGVGLGFNLEEDINTSDPRIQVYVKPKLSIQELYKNDIVPADLRGVKTSVKEYEEAQCEVNKTKYRPLKGGISCGHSTRTTGTLGMTFKYNGEKFILSNNHVLANVNDYNLEDSIIQPASGDGGDMSDTVANLFRVVNLNKGDSLKDAQKRVSSRILRFSRCVFGLGKKTEARSLDKKVQKNKVDTAVAKVKEDVSFSEEILEIGEINGIKEPEIGMNVKKVGRTTGFTDSKIVQMDASVDVNYTSEKLHFTDQVLTKDMSDPGDSGSVILSEDNFLVGLLFAGGSNYTIMNKISNVFQHLNMYPDNIK